MRILLLITVTTFAVGCGGKKEPVAETKPAEAVSVSPYLHYDIKGDEVIITFCDTKASGSLIIPATIEGKPVTSIGYYAFHNCTNLTRIAFGENSQLNTIGNHAFDRFSSLTSINIPDGVTSIGRASFNLCSALASITIPDSVTSIGDGALSQCKGLTSITIPDSVTSIGDGAFHNCYKLAEVTIGDSVTSIGDDVFYLCISLTAVTFLGDAPEEIGDAFLDSELPTIYRKPEAKGWGETWGGRPVKLISEKP